MHIIDVVTHDLRDIDKISFFIAATLSFHPKSPYYYYIFFSHGHLMQCVRFRLSRIVLTRNREIFFMFKVFVLCIQRNTFAFKFTIQPCPQQGNGMNKKLNRNRKILKF